jgi:hypothetical protein
MPAAIPIRAFVLATMITARSSPGSTPAVIVLRPPRGRIAAGAAQHHGARCVEAGRDSGVRLGPVADPIKERVE